jgi:formate hydrogenlyase subunit 3/multisubunit Na+/H+ antiporter MnhD subunit
MLIVGLLRRKFLLAATSTGLFAVIIAIFTLYVPLNEAIELFGISTRIDSRWIILGRSFVLDSSNRATIGFIFFSGGFILLGGWTARPERMFFSLGIGSLALVAASMMIEPFLFAAIFIELGAIIASVMLSSRRLGRNRGGLRLLVLISLAMLAILMVGWLLEVNQEEIELEGLSLRASLLLGFGFCILLSIPPFHSWIPISSTENHPFAWAYASMLIPTAGFFFIIHFLGDYGWLNEKIDIYGALMTIGSFMSVLGALWACVQDDLRKMASYSLVADIGVMLVAFGIGTNEGLQIALVLTCARVVSVAVLAQGLTLHLNLSEGAHNTVENVQKTTGSMNAAILIGLASLAGLPLTAGFPGRWELFKILTQTGHNAWIAVFCSILLLSITTIRSRKLLPSYQIESAQHDLGWIEQVFLWGGIVVTLVLGLFPQIVYPWINMVMKGLA